MQTSNRVIFEQSTDLISTEELPSLIGELNTESEVPPGTLIPVRLKSVLTEIGTIQIWCMEENGSGEWKLEYEIRELEIEAEA